MSSKPILENVKRLARNTLVVRIPLIPGITDTDANVRAIFEFMCDAGFTRAELLPYNLSAGAKYEWLGRTYGIEGEAQTPQRLDELVDTGRRLGLSVAVG